MRSALAIMVAVFLAFLSAATAGETVPSSETIPTDPALLRQLGVPEGEGWPWHFPPVDPSERPLPDGLPSLWVIYHLAAEIASGNSGAPHGGRWVPQPWCKRWDDGCTVCERTKAGGRPACRPNRKVPEPARGCWPALRMPSCTAVDLRAFERACAYPKLAIYASNAVSGPGMKGLPKMVGMTIQPMDLESFEVYSRLGKAAEKELNDGVSVLGTSWRHFDGVTYPQEFRDRDMRSGKIKVRLARSAASKYHICRMENERMFACGWHRDGAH